jgi:hypothetical protein
MFLHRAETMEKTFRQTNTLTKKRREAGENPRPEPQSGPKINE